MTETEPKRAEATTGSRWYRLTPGRCVAALLAVECLLWLAEQYQRLAWNWSWTDGDDKWDWRRTQAIIGLACGARKGWSVQIALALCLLTLAALLIWFLLSLVLRRRFQFGLRTVLLLPLAVAIPCGWLAAEVRNANVQREAVKEFGRWARYDYAQHGTMDFREPAPAWLLEMFGVDFFCEVDWAAVDADMQTCRLSDFPRLEGVCLYRIDRGSDGRPTPVSAVTDAGLARAARLRRLQRLSMDRAKVTDDGLRYVAPLAELERLSLADTDIGDAGLAHLRGLVRLRRLNLAGTRVTDAGLAHLKGLAGLQYLDLSKTRATAVGVKELQQALPNCMIILPNGVINSWPPTPDEPQGPAAGGRSGG